MKRILSKLYYLNLKIESDKRELERLGDNNYELKEKIERELAEYYQEYENVRSIIEKVEDDKLKLVLKLRYIEFMTWERIALKLRFTTQWVHELHKKALKEIVKFYNS